MGRSSPSVRERVVGVIHPRIVRAILVVIAARLKPQWCGVVAAGSGKEDVFSILWRGFNGLKGVGGRFE